jgi:hypothetical protein
LNGNVVMVFSTYSWLLNEWVSCILRINFSLSLRSLKRLKDVVLNIHEENEYNDKERKQRVVNLTTSKSLGINNSSLNIIIDFLFRNGYVQINTGGYSAGIERS